MKAFGLPADLRLHLVGRPPGHRRGPAARRGGGQAHRRRQAPSSIPDVTLSAYVGQQSLGLSQLFNPAAAIGSFGPAITLPIFEGGRLRGQYRGARADYAAAVDAYDATLTQALQDVADAAASVQSAAAPARRPPRGARRPASRPTRWRRERYQGGLSSYVSVLTAENAVIDERRAFADAQSRAFSLDIALVRALGGGYAARLSQSGTPRWTLAPNAPSPLRPPSRRRPAAADAGRPWRTSGQAAARVAASCSCCWAPSSCWRRSSAALYWVLVGSHHVSTDDAYVNADVADVTPLVTGPIIAAPATDTMPVKKGDVLVVIDPTDFKLALAEDEAALGQAQRKVEGYFANRDADSRHDRRQGRRRGPRPRPARQRRGRPRQGAAPTSPAARRSPPTARCPATS